MSVNQTLVSGVDQNNRHGCHHHVPRISLRLAATPKQETTLRRFGGGDDRVWIYLKLEDDGQHRPCTIGWDPWKDAFRSSRFALRHHCTTGEVKELEIDREVDSTSVSEKPIIVGDYPSTYGIREVRSSKDTVYANSLTPEYREQMIIGEQYELVWKGGGIRYWEWGSERELCGRELSLRGEGERIILEGGASVFFTAVETYKREPPPPPPPLTPADRVHGSPILSVTTSINGPLEIRRPDGYSPLDVKVRVTYHGVSDNSKAKPIIFHNYAVTDYDDFTWIVQHSRRQEDKWRELRSQAFRCRIYIEEAPDRQVDIAQHKDVVSLEPGESWETIFSVSDYLFEDEFPDDFVTGDLLRVRFNGCVVDWWDWGNIEDHTNTVVTMPANASKFVKNERRAKLVIPKANDIEVKIIE